MITLALDIITTAAILFIVSAGLLIVFGVMKIINFAHGVVHHGRRLCRAGRFPARAAAGAGARAGVRRRRPDLGPPPSALVVRRLYGRPLDAILATWGLGIVIGQVMTLVFGREVQFVPAPVSGTVDDFRRGLFGLSSIDGAGGDRHRPLCSPGCSTAHGSAFPRAP